MKKTFLYSVTLLMIGLYLLSCKKTTDTPATTPTTPTTVDSAAVIVGGATSAYKDTVVYKANTVTIKYSRTSQCYPSNEIFAFTGNATDVPTNAIYSWDFGDGHAITGSSTAGNIYKTAGNYTVTLTISDGTTKKSLYVTTVNISVYGQQVSPHASFYAQLFDINYPNNLNFNATGSTVYQGHITNYTWIWGDQTTSGSATADNVPHNFPLVGSDITYPVKLIVTASSGCKDTATVPVYIGAVYSNISGDFDTLQNNACTAETFTFTPNAINVPAGAVYIWDFSDATGTATSSGAIQHTFTYQNTYDVKMYISMNGKIIYTTHRYVWANGQNIRPKALFFKNISGDETTTYVKWAMYSAANVAHGGIVGYQWYMDNVLIDLNTNGTYETYPFNKTTSASTHTITFIVTSNVGCKDTASSTITIPPIGQYTY